MKNEADEIRAALADLGGSLKGLAELGVTPEELETFLASPAKGREGLHARELEAIIELHRRPVLHVVGDKIEKAQSAAVEATMKIARPKVEPLLPSIGRVDLLNGLRGDWVGTAWMVAKNVMVTNRHVALEFTRTKRDGQRVIGRNEIGQKLEVVVDTRQERESRERRGIRVRGVLHVEDDEGPDIAFLEVRETEAGDSLNLEPIALAKNDPEPKADVVLIGYPGSDVINNNEAVVHRIFGMTFGIKRCQPGKITGVEPNYLTHDCSTLKGNSGSVMFDPATGDAVGLHFGGAYRRANYAVKASTLRRRLEELGLS